MKKQALLCFIAIYCCLLQSCQVQDTDAGSQLKAKALKYIGSSYWRLIQINGAEPVDTGAHLIFDIEAGKFSGNSGCNHISGTAKIKEETIAFGSIITTEVACMNEKLTKLEHDFMRLLSKGLFQYDIADQTLNLYLNNKLVLMFGRYEPNE